MSGQGQQFYGKFRGVVTDNDDPNKMGRIRAKVPDIFSDEKNEMDSGWAMPSVPFAAEDLGIFMIPPKGANVWIEFEHGEPDYPIWSGCFWAEKKAPASSPDKKMIKTKAGTITLDDSDGSGSITIETSDGLKVTMGNGTIDIANGSNKISLSSGSVSINDGALEVT